MDMKISGVREIKAPAPATQSKKNAQKAGDTEEYTTTVKSGEKLSNVIDRAIKEDPAIRALLEKYPCLRRDIMKMNNIDDPARLLRGAKIRIPHSLKGFGIDENFNAENLIKRSTAELIELAKNEGIDTDFENLYYDPTNGTASLTETYRAKELVKALVYKITQHFSQKDSFSQEGYAVPDLKGNKIGYFKEDFWRKSVRFAIDHRAIQFGDSFSSSQDRANRMDKTTLTAIINTANEEVVAFEKEEEANNKEFENLARGGRLSLPVKLATVSVLEYFVPGDVDTLGTLQIKELTDEQILELSGKLHSFIYASLSNPERIPAKVIIAREDYIAPIKKALKLYVASKLEQNQYLKDKIAEGKALVSEEAEGSWISNESERSEAVFLMQTALHLTGRLGFKDFQKEKGEYELRNWIGDSDHPYGYQPAGYHTKTASALVMFQTANKIENNNGDLISPENFQGYFGRNSLEAMLAELRK
jgi:hypothetical protein